MKNIISLCFVAGLVVFSSSALHAADLENRDNVSYTIYIDFDDTSSVITIEPNETIFDICDDCYLEIEGNPDGLTIDDNVKIIINDGKLIIDTQS